jgi:hypothetical protein
VAPPIQPTKKATNTMKLGIIGQAQRRELDEAGYPMHKNIKDLNKMYEEMLQERYLAMKKEENKQ